MILLQACVKIDDSATKEGDISAVCEACKEFNLNHGIIITEDHEEEIFRENKVIQCIPFWKWAQVKLV